MAFPAIARPLARPFGDSCWFSLVASLPPSSRPAQQQPVGRPSLHLSAEMGVCAEGYGDGTQPAGGDGGREGRPTGGGWAGHGERAGVRAAPRLLSCALSPHPNP